MISCTDLFKVFKKNDLLFFTGIPDSTFKGWMSFLAGEVCDELTHVVPCNECEAVAISAGYHLSTGKIAVVYLQNSGEGKIVNPITSLCDPDVYSIPVLLMIGWRGEPGKKDEPQHKKMGRVMVPLLETLEIPYEILPDNIEMAGRTISKMKLIAMEKKMPVAIIVRKGVIEPYSSGHDQAKISEMTREDAIKIILDNILDSAVIVSTTGKASRELFEYRIERGDIPQDFYTVGGMGCAASIAFGIAIEHPEKRIFVFDGDGAALMQMGSLATIGHYKPDNFTHIIFDNEAHDSTGGQMTVSNTVNFKDIALACGYRSVKISDTRSDLLDSLKSMGSLKGPQMLIVQVKKGSRADLGRPTTTPIENKEKFMSILRG